VTEDETKKGGNCNIMKVYTEVGGEGGSFRKYHTVIVGGA